MERNSKQIKVRCWQQLRLGSLGVSVSVGMFSSVLLSVREYQWSRQSLPVISIGLPEQQDFWGTDGSLATQWTLQLFIHGYWHPICVKFLPTAPFVDQSELLLCPAQVLGRVPGRLRVLRTNCQTFAGAVLGNLARGEINPITEPAAQMRLMLMRLLPCPTLGSDLLLRPEAAAVRTAGSGQIFGWRQIRDVTGGCDRRSKPVWHRVDPWFWVQLLSFLLIQFFFIVIKQKRFTILWSSCLEKNQRRLTMSYFNSRLHLKVVSTESFWSTSVLLTSDYE